MPYPFPFPEHPPPTTFRDVPIFLRKFYHTDYIDVVPPQKITKQKKYSKVHNILHVFTPLVTPLKVQKKIPPPHPIAPLQGLWLSSISKITCCTRERPLLSSALAGDRKHGIHPASLFTSVSLFTPVTLFNLCPYSPMCSYSPLYPCRLYSSAIADGTSRRKRDRNRD